MTDSTGNSTWGMPAPNGARSRGRHAAPAGGPPAGGPPAAQAPFDPAPFDPAPFAPPPAAQPAFDPASFAPPPPTTQASFDQAPFAPPPAAQPAFDPASFAPPPTTQASFDPAPFAPPPAAQPEFAQPPAEYGGSVAPQAWNPPAAPGAPGVQQKTPEQLAYERGQQDMRRKLTTPRMTPYRVVCGICWAVWTLLFGVSALVSLSQGGIGTFFIAGALAGLAGWYDFRIWTLKARRLTLFIIF
jgi:hypothetical protein